jgi:DNA-binding response OmpR family regulator
MAKVLVIETEPAMRKALEAALTTAGHQIVVAADNAEVEDQLQRRAFEVLLIRDGASTREASKLAIEIEKHGIKAVIMAKSAERVDALRAKGLISFHMPEDTPGLEAAIRARI